MIDVISSPFARFAAWMASQPAGSWLLLIQDVLLLLNLIAIGFYVMLTRGIARASLAQSKAANQQTRSSQELVAAANLQVHISQELVAAANKQSEGLSKPVILAGPIARDQSFLIVSLLNIGTGPAIDIRGVVVEGPGSNTERRLHLQWLVPYLEAHQSHTARVATEGADAPRRAIECTYRSISDIEYVSITELDERDKFSDLRIEAKGRRHEPGRAGTALEIETQSRVG